MLSLNKVWCFPSNYLLFFCLWLVVRIFVTQDNVEVPYLELGLESGTADMTKRYCSEWRGPRVSWVVCEERDLISRGHHLPEKEPLQRLLS